MKGIGLITLSTDPVGEDAFKAEMAGSPVRVFTTRTSYDEADHQAGGFTPIPDWPTVLGTLPPGNLIDVIAFSCTSATVALGNETLVRLLGSARPGLRYTSPGIASIAMMQRYKVKRIALLTPYGSKLHHAMPPYFSRYGIEVVAHHSLARPLNLVTDEDIASVPLNRIQTELESLLAAARPVDALFVSCAAFSIQRSNLAQMEVALACPVLASVNSMAWHTLDLLGEHTYRDRMAVELGLLSAGL
ncbi:hypothetical protein PYH37_006109 (plasmid) [Sinorhizobium numidicum]|uniref:Asp/Glu racemase n=1 Tax=Sinorhizobium numidicum TaxID=680248 RepID=A0ABY8D4N3_9HYPH|nr:hypothetical protein [Sinorhizobium numidicum]WEX79690.1 hypothetical protein PYH37_006109 [Sinorhizobium numidicum]WEX85357.1 hypothetical protein PYH38_006278 [Sinorhizobium numidicum]